MRVRDDVNSLSGSEKAAIFILSLGEDQAAKLFGLMDDEEIKEISQTMARLGSVSYQAVLARGFALVQDAEGATLTAAADVPAGGRLVLTFADGQVGTTADGTKPGPGRRRDGRDSAGQGALL